MRNTQLKWFLLVLAGVVLILACLFSGGWVLLTQVAPALLGNHGQPPSGGGDCGTREPSFGGNVVVDSNQVVCSDLISFGGTVAINGEVKGNVVVLGGNVVIAGTVDGDINEYGGMVTLQSG